MDSKDDQKRVSRRHGFGDRSKRRTKTRHPEMLAAWSRPGRGQDFTARISALGEMAERFKAAVSKTVVGSYSTPGSNPGLSAIETQSPPSTGEC